MFCSTLQEPQQSPPTGKSAVRAQRSARTREYPQESRDNAKSHTVQVQEQESDCPAGRRPERSLRAAGHGHCALFPEPSAGHMCDDSQSTSDVNFSMALQGDFLKTNLKMGVLLR